MRGAHWQLKTKRRSITIGVNKYINPIILAPHCDIQSSVLNKLQRREAKGEEAMRRKAIEAKGDEVRAFFG